MSDDGAKKRKFSTKSFLRGLLVVVLLYAAGAGWFWLKKDETANAQQAKLASQTVLIEKTTPVAGMPEQLGEETLAVTSHEQTMAPAQSQEETVAAEEQTHSTVSDESTTSETKEDKTEIPDNLQRLENGLAAAPIEGLYEESPEGRLPVIRAKDKLTPFQAYRRPFDRAAVNTPLVSIIIADIGLSDAASGAVLSDLPPEISLALSPYAKTPDLWATESRQRGHEIWMMMPMETAGYPLDDTGPHTVLVSAPERQNQIKLSWLMGLTTGYIGFIAPQNPAFMSALNDLRPLLGNIYGRGLAFVGGSEVESGAAVAQSMALGQNAPYGTVDVWIDSPPTKEQIETALEKLEDIATEKGAAVGVIHPLPLSYQALQNWTGTLSAKNLTLAPLSAQLGF